MTDKERKEFWNAGWDAYFDGKGQDACTNDPDQEKRDEWMGGWLAAQDAAQYEVPYIPPTEETI